MLKKIGFIFMVLSGVAQAQSLDECIAQASYVDPIIGAPEISESCKTTVAQSANTNSIDYSNDNYIQAFAAGNILYTIFYENDSAGNPVVSVEGLSAGRFTSFTNLKALEVDEVGKRIFLLDEELDGSYSVISVAANKVGSLAPKTKLFSEELNEAENIKLDSENQELYVMGSNWIKIFNLNAYSGSFKAEHSDKKLRAIAGNITGLENIKDLTIKGDKVYVLDGSRILEFARNSSQEDQSASNQFDLPTSGVAIENINGVIQVKLENEDMLEI